MYLHCKDIQFYISFQNTIYTNAPSFSSLYKPRLTFSTATLIDVVKPVDQVEEGERNRENHARPLVYGVDIREVGDLDFELRGPPPQAPLLVAHWPVEGRSSVQVSAGHGLAVLYAGAVVGEHRSPRVIENTHHICSTHLTGQVGQEDVAMSVNLRKGMSLK